MIQRDAICRSPLEAGPSLMRFAEFLRRTPHHDAILTIYETSFSIGELTGMLRMIRKLLPGVKIAGISTYIVADIRPDGMGVRLNLLVSEKADFEVVSLPCEPGQEDLAVLKMKEHLNRRPDAKAVELMVCGMALRTTDFIKGFADDREDLIVFGTMSSQDIPDTMRSRGLLKFDVFHMSDVFYSSNQYLYTENTTFETGFICVIFSGEELHVHSEYALGWRAIGPEMSVKLGGKAILGETSILEIEGKPATSVFEEYLGIIPDKYLISNICEFPFIVQRDGIDICLIPFDYAENGEMFFHIKLLEGEKIRFSFASHACVLGSSEESCRKTNEFVPEALFLMMCGNRINFLREDASIEWNIFKKDHPATAVIHGASEIYYHQGKGGILNSAHITIAMREGPAKEEDRIKYPEEAVCPHVDGVVPLAERMSVFLGKMTDQLQAKALEAQAANYAKSAFLSNMSHEIRTPINAILGMDEMILRESNEAGILDYAEDIRSAGNSLLGIINDVLDFSKIEAGKLNIISVEYEFASVINDLYHMLKKRIDDKGLTMKLEVDPDIPSILYGDEIRIKQVITNILTNAVKYTDKGSVTLRINRIRSTEEEIQKMREDCHGSQCYNHPVRLSVAVIDTGIGIRPEDKARLFRAFERVDEERNRTIEGTGLGLNITAQLLRLMGSKLSVDSVYGEGSTFSFELIQGISRDEPIGDINARFLNAGAVKRKKYNEKFTAEEAEILVVDDTKMNLDVIINLLKKTKIRIDTAISGEEALQLVKKKRYDLIFLDHRMPKMDGMECFRLMQEMPDNASAGVPVISLTANAVSGAREEYLEAGFADYLTKPIDVEKLEDMLLRYLPEEKVVITPVEELSVKESSEGFTPTEKAAILLIDDEVLIHEIAEQILGSIYDFKAVSSGAEGLKILAEEHVDLILLDVKMPEEDGFSVLKKLKDDERTSGIPVIFLTGDDNRDTEVEGLRSGAWDYVKKPFVSEVLLQRVQHTIELSHLQQDLTKEVAIQTIRAEHLSQEVMLALSKAVDAKDHYTNGHSERVAGYATMLSAKLGMSESEQAEIYSMGLLHDVGKIGVHEDIINKPARLTDEEFSQIKMHTTMGYDILTTITELPSLATGARWHHERYDGTGYPDGKKEKRSHCRPGSYVWRTAMMP